MRLVFAGLLMLVWSSFTCMADEAPAAPDPIEQPMTFVFEDGVIKAIGAIEGDTDDVFRAFLIEQGKLGQQWHVPVLMRSPGGALETALHVGRMIRESQMSTVTDNLCASACTYMFMGGVNRVAAQGTIYAVHQFYNDWALKEPDKPIYSANDLIKKQKLIANMQDYVIDMGVNAGVLALASRTSPVEGQDTQRGVLILTRRQLLAYNIENVPTQEADGQLIDQLSIPGVFPPQGQDVELQTVPQVSLQGLKPYGIKGILAVNLVRELFRTHEGSADDIRAFVDTSFSQVSSYYGQEYGKDGLLAVKLDFINRWPYRHYTVDESSLQTSCNDAELTCDVRGEIDSQFGYIEGQAVEVHRSAFHFTVFSPSDNPRITVEEGNVLQ